MHSVLAKELATVTFDDSYTTQEWDINGKTAVLGIKKA